VLPLRSLKALCITPSFLIVLIVPPIQCIGLYDPVLAASPSPSSKDTGVNKASVAAIIMVGSNRHSTQQRVFLLRGDFTAI
jgi:hypothetical protein